tara:strand:- start:111 stop:710 length:600 start_codon:yes stop_codon:yes gene_type:complete
MALSKIQSESVNLADDFAFTGTVSGAGAMEHISTTDVTTPAQFVVFDNLSTAYDTFVFQYEFHPDTDSTQFGIQFLDSSGTAIDDTEAYGVYNDFDGSAISDDDQNYIPISAGTIGNDNHEGLRGQLTLLGRNYAVATDTVPPCVIGSGIGHYISNVYSGGTINGGLNSEYVEAIRGVRFFTSANNIERGKVYLFGVRS